MSNMNLYLPADGFRSHRHSGTDISLYHVYDSLSQTPYVPGYGISCGDPNTYLIHPQHLITYANIGKHLRWQNREPTIFISLFDNLEAAHSEAQRRVQNPWVSEAAAGRAVRRQPFSVRIAEVSARRLDWANVFYFSTGELIQMLRLPGNHALRPSLNRAEWFVLGDIPTGAILADYRG